MNPNEIWSQETGAVHFTIKIDIQDNKLSFGLYPPLISYIYKSKSVPNWSTFPSEAPSAGLAPGIIEGVNINSLG